VHVMSLNRLSARRKQEVVGLLALMVAVLTLGSLVTNSDIDERFFMPGFGKSLSEVYPENAFGYAGMIFSHYGYTLLGLAALFAPVWLGMTGLRLLLKWKNALYVKRLLCALGLMFSIAVFLSVQNVNPPLRSVTYTETLGGLSAHVVASLLSRIVGYLGAYIVSGVAGLVFVLLLVEWRPQGWEKKVRGVPAYLWSKLTSVARDVRREKSTRAQSRAISADSDNRKPFWKRLLTMDFDFLSPAIGSATRDSSEDEELSYVRSRNPGMSENFMADYERIKKEVLEREPDQISDKTNAGNRDGSLETRANTASSSRKSGALAMEDGAGSVESDELTIDLLDENPQPILGISRAELEETAANLLSTLKTFGVKVDGNRIEKHPGPVITRYEFKPGMGVKVNQIVNLADDLALALSAKHIRIVAPIPGKAAVGIEIPNKSPQRVYLRDILGSDDYADGAVRLPMALGKTTSGEPFVADLALMPHLLVAGATGSGKSVCLNVIITSLIYRHQPDSLRFLFVDPKMLELTVYKGLPHLERPVVTSSRKAERLLNDAVAEMEMRYKKLASQNVRNIEDYNSKAEPDGRLPYIVIVVDELADLMMSNASTRMETLITRLAQMARAVGIHLILATQRPSVDVITGLIKANFPARIAFQVATKVDSRTILDGNGAEKLLGRGDMLFLQPGQPDFVRIHGSYVSSEETARIMGILHQKEEEVARIENFSEEASKKREQDLDKDPLLREAAELVVKHKQGSVSLLQRRLGIGYQRAARLIDQLEELKIVGAYDGSKAREVLIDEAYLGQLLKNH
jgi:hypothetical protein